MKLSRLPLLVVAYLFGVATTLSFSSDPVEKEESSCKPAAVSNKQEPGKVFFAASTNLFTISEKR